MDWQEIVFDEISIVRDKNYNETSSNAEKSEIQKSTNDLQLALYDDENFNNLYIVIDTNVFLHDLPFVRELVLTNQKKGNRKKNDFSLKIIYQNQFTIVKFRSSSTKSHYTIYCFTRIRQIKNA